MSIATKCICGASPYYCNGSEHCMQVIAQTTSSMVNIGQTTLQEPVTLGSTTLIKHPTESELVDDILGKIEELQKIVGLKDFDKYMTLEDAYTIIENKFNQQPCKEEK